MIDQSRPPQNPNAAKHCKPTYSATNLLASGFWMGSKAGKRSSNEAWHKPRRSERARSPTPETAKSRRQKCPRQDSNLYAVSDTGPSNQPVYQFQHVGIGLHH
jgi:hypothetical protein